MRSLQVVELGRQLHALATLSLDAAPVPLAVNVEVDVAHVHRLVADLVLAGHPAAVRAVGQHVRVAEHECRVHRHPADLEHVLADGGGDDLALPATSGVAGSADLDLAVGRVEPRGGFGGSLGDKVREDEHPLAIPAEYAAPQLVPAVGRHLLLEAALDSAEEDTQGTLDGLVGLGVEDQAAAGVVREVAEGRAAEVGDEMAAGNVQVREEGRVALVQVVVDLEERRAGGGDHGLEEARGSDGGRPADEVVVDDAVEDAELENRKRGSDSAFSLDNRGIMAAWNRSTACFV